MQGYASTRARRRVVKKSSSFQDAVRVWLEKDRAVWEAVLANAFDSVHSRGDDLHKVLIKRLHPLFSAVCVAWMEVLVDREVDSSAMEQVSGELDSLALQVIEEWPGKPMLVAQCIGLVTPYAVMARVVLVLAPVVEASHRAKTAAGQLDKLDCMLEVAREAPVAWQGVRFLRGWLRSNKGAEGVEAALGSLDECIGKFIAIETGLELGGLFATEVASPVNAPSPEEEEDTKNKNKKKKTKRFVGRRHLSAWTGGQSCGAGTATGTTRSQTASASPTRAATTWPRRW